MARLYKDADEMLQEALDGVLIGTRCHLHHGNGVKVLEKHRPLSKSPWPSILKNCCGKEAYEQSSSKVVVSFPLKMSMCSWRRKSSARENSARSSMWRP